ncbi:hypothetical protein VBM87_02100 [Mycoplasma sp. 744]|uniref:hypothetical protein n=1 Tax=Mycoplasma sp. 744 TaxID=3108531 RepID=UPI002B1D6A88|nr:hypothetical protein [Mycoplasma sp. 744]MEA4115564.1 hypothetical protein [Mycoplasma sp. 744]
MSSPQIAIPSYNKSNFSDEIKYATILTEEEVKQKKEEILQKKEKTAENINYTNINFNQILNKTNELLGKKFINNQYPRFNNKEKIEFAQKGIKLHEKGDICLFCGNVISDIEYDKLSSFFIEHEVEKFQKDIREHVEVLKSYKEKINSININKDNFYDSHLNEITFLREEVEKVKENQINFLESLIKKLNERNENIFGDRCIIDYTIDDKLGNLINNYNNIVIDNNKIEIEKKQEETKNKLRYHKLKKW